MSLHAVSVPTFLQTLKALTTVLGKAEAHCEAKKIPEEALLTARLFPDMFPLTRQVQSANGARGYRTLDLSATTSDDVDGTLLSKLGLRPYVPHAPAVLVRPSCRGCSAAWQPRPGWPGQSPIERLACRH